MRILVTGATGFIGRGLVERLLKQGHEVRAFSRRPETLLEAGIQGASLIKGDLSDPVEVLKAVRDCQRVYHLGALARAWSPKSSDFDLINIQGTRHLLEACREASVERVVHTSTVMAIGPTDGFIANESTPLFPRPLSHYSRTKAEAEKVVSSFIHRGVPVVMVLPSLVFGPSTGSRRVSFNRFLHDFIRGRPIVIPGDGSQLMNCVYLDDVIEGHIQAMERGLLGNRYILGGENISVSSLTNLVNKIAPPQRRIFYIPVWVAKIVGLLEITRARLTHGIPLLTWSSVETYRHSWAYDSKKAIRELGYQPRTLEEGLRSTIQWLQSK